MRVVSLPCFELFDEQPRAYRDEVLPPAVTARVSVEAGITFGWERYVGAGGVSIGIDRYGASAPAGRIFAELGITAERGSARRRSASSDDGRPPLMRVAARPMTGEFAARLLRMATTGRRAA